MNVALWHLVWALSQIMHVPPKDQTWCAKIEITLKLKTWLKVAWTKITATPGVVCRLLLQRDCTEEKLKAELEGWALEKCLGLVKDCPNQSNDSGEVTKWRGWPIDFRPWNVLYTWRNTRRVVTCLLCAKRKKTKNKNKNDCLCYYHLWLMDSENPKHMYSPSPLGCNQEQIIACDVILAQPSRHVTNDVMHVDVVVFFTGEMFCKNKIKIVDDFFSWLLVVDEQWFSLQIIIWWRIMYWPGGRRVEVSYHFLCEGYKWQVFGKVERKVAYMMSYGLPLIWESGATKSWMTTSDSLRVYAEDI